MSPFRLHSLSSVFLLFLTVNYVFIIRKLLSCTFSFSSNHNSNYFNVFISSSFHNIYVNFILKLSAIKIIIFHQTDTLIILLCPSSFSKRSRTSLFQINIYIYLSLTACAEPIIFPWRCAATSKVHCLPEIINWTLTIAKIRQLLKL